MGQLILDLTKAGEAYIRKWRGKNNKWYYEYPKEKYANKYVKQPMTKEKATKKARDQFASATEKMGWASTTLVTYLDDKFGITSFDDLMSQVKTGGTEKASEIYRSSKDYIDKIGALSTGAKGELIHRLGQALVAIRDHHSTVGKTSLMIKVKTPEGKVKYKPKKAPQAAFPASKIKTAKTRMGGWTDIAKLPTVTQIKSMVTKKMAKITSGKLSAKNKLEVYAKTSKIVVPFKENAKGVVFQARQYKKNKDRKSTTAMVELTIPYPFVRSFMKKHIPNKRIQTEVFGQMERSAGYKKTLGIV